jgi:hypothetical protein
LPPKLNLTYRENGEELTSVKNFQLKIKNLCR